MKSDVYQQIFPTRITGKDSETEVETNQGGRILAVSFEAAPTGRGCDGLIIDDPIKSNDANSFEALDVCYNFYRDALLSRLNNPAKNFILVVMQRLAMGDLTGRLEETKIFKQLSLPLQAEEDERISYTSVTGAKEFIRAKGVPLNPTRMTEAQIQELRRQWHPAAFDAQQQQRPHGAGEVLIRSEWLKYYDAPMRDGIVVQSWDTAGSESETASFSVCLTWRMKPNFFQLVDVFRERIHRDQLSAKAVELAKKHNPKYIFVEDASSGHLVATMLRSQYNRDRVFLRRPSMSKAQRLEAYSCAFIQNAVWLPHAAPWLEEYRSELLSFPNGRHDDQVDATTQYLSWAIPASLGERVDPPLHLYEHYIAPGVDGGMPTHYQIGRSIVRTNDVVSERPKHRGFGLSSRRRRW